MKNLSSLCAMLLFCISALCQVPVQYNEKLFVGFQREDGVFVIYDAKGVVMVKDGKFAEGLVTSELKLSKFLAITDFYATLDEARARLGLSSINSIPVPVQNVRHGVDWSIGQVGYFYGSKYADYVNQITGGDAIFEFYGQNVNYPSYNPVNNSKSTNELVRFYFPTHSVVTGDKNLVSAIEMKLYDFDGNLIWYLNDSRGGYHPCTNSPNCTAQLRSNNHPDDSVRWLKYGKYTLWVKNNSTDIRAVQLIDFRNISSNNPLRFNLGAGSEKTFDVDIVKLPDVYDSYKLNCNVYTN